MPYSSKENENQQQAVRVAALKEAKKLQTVLHVLTESYNFTNARVSEAFQAMKRATITASLYEECGDDSIDKSATVQKRIPVLIERYKEEITNIKNALPQFESLEQDEEVQTQKIALIAKLKVARQQLAILLEMIPELQKQECDLREARIKFEEEGALKQTILIATNRTPKTPPPVGKELTLKERRANKLDEAQQLINKKHAVIQELITKERTLSQYFAILHKIKIASPESRTTALLNHLQEYEKTVAQLSSKTEEDTFDSELSTASAKCQKAFAEITAEIESLQKSVSRKPWHIITLTSDFHKKLDEELRNNISSEAYTAALSLYDELSEAQIVYEADLRANRPTADADFQSKCSDLIETTLDTLEEDLTILDFIKRFFINLINAITGNKAADPNRFFSATRNEVEKLRTELLKVDTDPQDSGPTTP